MQLVNRNQNTLTLREQQVLELLSDMHSYKSAAKSLSISVNTVRRHAANIYKKLGVRNKTQAMVKVYLE